MRLCLALVLAASTAMPALAASKKDECALQAAIVTRATELRQERKSEKKTTEILQGGDEAVAEKYIPAVPHIVDWVYTLKRKQLKEDPGAAYLEACLAN